MGLFSILGSLTLVFIVFLYGLGARVDKLKSLNDLDRLTSESTLVSTQPVTHVYNEEEAEKALIRTCQFLKSWILRCKMCGTEGKIYCPYPTDSFCKSAINTDLTDASFLWSFLPNKSGALSSLTNYSTIKYEDLTNVSQIGAAGRWLLVNALDFSKYKDLKYEKPEGNMIDPCAVEGIVKR